MPAPYPTPEYGGARYTIFGEDPRDYDKAVQENEMKDGSASYWKQASQGIRLFRFEYLLTPEEIVIHDGHFNACFGKWLGFDFYVPRPAQFGGTGEYLQNVHYKSYEPNRSSIAWRLSRTVVLIWRPAGSSL